MPAPHDSGHTREPIHTVAAVITRDDGRVLLVRKRGTRIFIQPGGKREPGEASLATLSRELDEELGVTFDLARARYLGTFEDVAVHEPGRRVRAEAWVVGILGEPRTGAEIEALAWIDPLAHGHVDVAPLSARHILPVFAATRG
ncbi:NUDIX hydrolase [Dokdonella sp. MW10]|uniref:NUDIX hydrolase n=1 Tax=Dokdonella sp. MW10 TaxID=2992926 RepID=UPI003F808FDC